MLRRTDEHHLTAVVRSINLTHPRKHSEQSTVSELLSRIDRSVCKGAIQPDGFVHNRFFSRVGGGKQAGENQ